MIDEPPRVGPVTELARMGYRLAAQGLFVYRWLFRPEVRGVRCIVVRDQRALVVRHTYGDRRWSFPGGQSRRGEAPLETARREMREELGFEIDEWIEIGELRVNGGDRATHVIACLLGEWRGGEPEARGVEIAQHTWTPLDALPEPNLDGIHEIADWARAALRSRS